MSEAEAKKAGSKPCGPPMTNAALAMPWSRAAKREGKTPACHLLAVYVEGNHVGAGHQPAPNGFRLIPHAIAGPGGTALPGLAEFDAGKADRAASGGGPLDVARGQVPFRSGFRPPNAN